jgi:hypothetical protein
MFIKRSLKIFVIVIVAFVFTSVTYAFAASNTVPATRAGDGFGAISGYTISNVVYNLNSDPTTIDTVDFTLNLAAATVKIKLVAAGSTWYGCTVTGGTTISCTTTGATVLSADQLKVVAVGP